MSTEDLGERLRAARTAAGHDQERAAAVIGVARCTLQDWERGLARVPMAALDLYLLRTDQHPEYRLVQRRA